MELDRKNIHKLLLLIAFGIFLYWGLQNLSLLWALIRIILGLTAPFLIGGCIAFVLNVPMRFIERVFFAPKEQPIAAGKAGKPRQASKPKQKKSYTRPLSLVLTILLVVGIMLVVLFLIVPEIVNSFRMLKNNVPAFVEQVQSWGRQLSAQMPELAVWLQSNNLDWNSFDWAQIGQTVFNFLRSGAGNLLSSSFNLAASIFSGIVTGFLAVVFAAYILISKEKLGSQFKKILYAYLPEHRADRILEVGRLTERTFSKFLSGQCTEAVILGGMFFIVMSILRFPYALMISVLISVTALIPIFGVFIGCAVGAFLMLMQNPMQAVWFIVLFLVLQQIEGNFIYPKVVGNSVGLPSIWVLVAVTLGGSTMGVLGMLINIPLSSVVYSLVRESVQGKLKDTKIDPQKLK